MPADAPDESLEPGELDADPVTQFRRWLASAEARDVPLAEAAALATATPAGAPSARMVLVKGADERGFVFFTNYESRKARELDENPRAALVFYWNALGRQIRIEGTVKRVAEDESDTYFSSRARGSQIGAWASPQSVVIPHRGALEVRTLEVETRYADDVPRPPFWGGFRLAPSAIEFWQHRENRLHDRFRYTREESGSWKIERLAP